MTDLRKRSFTTKGTKIELKEKTSFGDDIMRIARCECGK